MYWNTKMGKKDEGEYKSLYIYKFRNKIEEIKKTVVLQQLQQQRKQVFFSTSGQHTLH